MTTELSRVLEVPSSAPDEYAASIEAASRENTETSVCRFTTYRTPKEIDTEKVDTDKKGATPVASQEDLIAGLAEIIEEVTGIEPSEVTVDKSFVDDLDIDSLSMVEIAVQTEDKYGVKIPDEDLAGLRTVGDAVSYIQKLEAENPEAAEAIKAKLDDSASE